MKEKITYLFTVQNLKVLHTVSILLIPINLSKAFCKGQNKTGNKSFDKIINFVDLYYCNNSVLSEFF